jgi:hypothetical protein
MGYGGLIEMTLFEKVLQKLCNHCDADVPEILSKMTTNFHMIYIPKPLKDSYKTYAPELSISLECKCDSSRKAVENANSAMVVIYGITSPSFGHKLFPNTDRFVFGSEWGIVRDERRLSSVKQKEDSACYVAIDSDGKVYRIKSYVEQLVANNIEDYWQMLLDDRLAGKRSFRRVS